MPSFRRFRFIIASIMSAHSGLALFFTCVLCTSFRLTHCDIAQKNMLYRILHNPSYDSTIRPGVNSERESLHVFSVLVAWLFGFGFCYKRLGTIPVTVNLFISDGGPVFVEVDMVINSVGPVNDKEMDFGISIFLRQEWTDPRLKFHEFNDSIVLGSKRLEEIWVPDVYFAQSKREQRHVITTPNILLRLTPAGRILYSQRISATIQCQMDLSKFPMDSQTCKLQIESYSFTTDDIVLLWSSKRAATAVLPDAYIPDFLLINTTAADCTTTYATGTFPCLKVELYLEREIGFYITQTYIPSILIVILSWASFWIDHEAIPARISVGLLTVLTITTQSSGARAQLPRVPYIKAIDVWMSVCLVCVFAAYMEYAVVTVLSRRYKKIQMERQMAENNAVCVTNITLQENHTSSSPSIKTGAKSFETSDKNTGRFVDKIARILFPCSFLLFNLVYWFYYIYYAA